MRYSVIIPTFNRCQLLARAVDSALAFGAAAGATETIIVDDASEDGTADMVRERYASEIETGLVKLIVRQVNGGVAAARNEAALVARGDWLIPLDSDDQFTPAAAASVSGFIERYSDAPLLLFRCETETGSLIGPPAPGGKLDLVSLLTGGTPGECLPVLRRTAFIAHPYDEDLRGFELLSYLRILKADGPAVLSNAVVRRYATTGIDRLSALSGRLGRADLIARGFSRMLDEFGDLIPVRRRVGLLVRIACYRIAAGFGFGR